MIVSVYSLPWPSDSEAAATAFLGLPRFPPVDAFLAAGAAAFLAPLLGGRPRPFLAFGEPFDFAGEGDEVAATSFLGLPRDLDSPDFAGDELLADF